MDSRNQKPNLTTKPNLKLHKSEKLCSQTAIDALFRPGKAAKGAIAYPLRMVAAPRTDAGRRAGAAKVQFLISVPKKRLRHAVERVMMRRRIREAFRLNRELIPAGSTEPVDVAFIYIGNSTVSYSRIEWAMKRLLSEL